MTVQEQLSNTPVQPVPAVDSLEAFDTIGNKGVAGVIWQRPIPEDFQNWINGLPPQNLPSVRAVLHPQNARTLVSNVCDKANTPEGSNRDWFVNDVCCLADAFAQIMSAPYLQLRFDVVCDNACRKFHIDMVRMRLICTYRGPGTEYGILQDENGPEQIFTVPTGNPILLRGALWPDQGPNSVRHRSPPIAGSGTTRLVLVLDSVESLDDPRASHTEIPKRRIAEEQPIDPKNERVDCP